MRRARRTTLAVAALLCATLLPTVTAEAQEATDTESELAATATPRQAREHELAELARQRLRLEADLDAAGTTLQELDDRHRGLRRELQRSRTATSSEAGRRARQLATELGSLGRERDAVLADRDARRAALAGVVEQERTVRLRHQRQRQVTDGAQSGRYSCIMDAGAYAFIDSWGFRRSGGRSHRGTDVMAPHGVNVYAMTDGTITRLSEGGIGGIALRMDGDDGAFYYYAHLAGFADGIEPGVRVEAGQLVGYNGDTGNARGGEPHVHLEVHPGGQGNATNPYQWLRNVCPVADERGADVDDG